MANSFARGGKENRYAADGGGNHIDYIRNKEPAIGLFLDISYKKCTCCLQRKPKKGGTNPTKKGWKCADCKIK